MVEQKKIIFTGGSGLLGSEFKKTFPKINYPLSSEFDVTNPTQMEKYVNNGNFSLILHAAAFTAPPKVEKNPLRALDVNIIGTANVVKLCVKYGLKLIYISTDYVFKGDKGNYQEDDPMLPVNKYAWSKLGGEAAVRLYDNSIIIRTTFGPNIFPYEKAFVDQWTSRESVAAIAGMISRLLDTDFTGIVHVGGERKTVFAYAKGLDQSRDIKELSVKDIDFNVPVDTSLDCSRYQDIIDKKINVKE